MTLPNNGDRGIEIEPTDIPGLDADKDGIIEDGLGDPAAPEDDSGD